MAQIAFPYTFHSIDSNTIDVWRSAQHQALLAIAGFGGKKPPSAYFRYRG